MRRIWVLGAPDPEMERIEEVIRGVDDTVVYATIGGRRVTPGEAYKADGTDPALPAERVPHGVIVVECGGPVIDCRKAAWGDVAAPTMDHHRPGDPGYGMPPDKFMGASSLGQVMAHVANQGGFNLRDSKWEVYGGVEYVEHAAVPQDFVMAAASDHCPAAAYAGKCPGVDPAELMTWRAITRATFQRRPVADVLRDVEAAMIAIKAAPKICIGRCEVSMCEEVTDMRGQPYIPELPEASLRLGIPILCQSIPDRDGRVKINLLGDTEGYAVQEFLGGWAEAHGIFDTYGDPARGFAGGYLV